jgi:hypothetical protein
MAGTSTRMYTMCAVYPRVKASRAHRELIIESMLRNQPLPWKQRAEAISGIPEQRSLMLFLPILATAVWRSFRRR